MSRFNWKMTITATVLSLAAAGIATTALASGQASGSSTGYGATRTVPGAQTSAPRAPVVEGRNAYVNEGWSPQLETYIIRQIEKDKRSN